MINVGLIGLGYWGPNLARVLNSSARCRFTACCDLDPDKVENIVRRHPGVCGYGDVDKLLSSDIDAVLIATNISTHYDLARRALMRGKHVLVEKPLTDSSATADALTRLAQPAGLTLMTGHTFIYSPAVVRVKELIESGHVGTVHYISMSRVNLGLYQADVDVVWDLAVHDVSILLYWLGECPVQAHCFGRACVQRAKRDVAFLGFTFPSGTIASCEVSWLAPQKMRRTCVVGSEKMIVYDDMDPSETIKIYERGVIVRPPDTFGEFQLTYRMGDVVSPNLANAEPLAVEVNHFIECVETGTPPLTDGAFGSRVVSSIEMALSRRLLCDEELCTT